MKVNEIFYSLQGEGFHTGKAAAFIRFSGCNLNCSFCDTDHSSHRDMSEDEIIAFIASYPSSHVVITGGEPTLQITDSFLKKLHDNGKYVQIETNGSIALPREIVDNIDWITCSPKNLQVKLGRIDELKVLYTGENVDMSKYSNLINDNTVLCLQPCDYSDCNKNKDILEGAIEFVKQNPRWRLSLQTHKLIDIK